MKTLSNQEIWTAFVKKVTARGCNDASYIAQRLHKGHYLIFGRNLDPVCLEEPKAEENPSTKKIISLLENILEALNKDIDKEVKAAIELEHERDKNNQITNIFNKWLYHSEKDDRNELNLWIEAYERFFEVIEKKEAKRKQMSNPH